MINEEALQEFIDWRTEAKKPMTERAIKMLRNKLEPYSLEIQRQAIERAIIAGWSGVFPEKERPVIKTNSTRDQDFTEQLLDRSWAQ